MQNLLTIKEVAQQLRLSELTTYRMTWAGEIASIKVKNKRLVPEAALDAYLAERTTHDNDIR